MKGNGVDECTAQTSCVGSTRPTHERKERKIVKIDINLVKKSVHSCTFGE